MKVSTVTRQDGWLCSLEAQSEYDREMDHQLHHNHRVNFIHQYHLSVLYWGYETSNYHPTR